MLWKVGGNFEPVAIICETNWKECIIAVANYLWSEVVSDVVDYLAKEGIIWVLAIAIASTILIHKRYCKNMHTENAALNNRILNRVGYKIQDLELKINVLMYKIQYGTWPLPHQICNLKPKLRKIRMTLSNPGDRKNWLKHVLLNPSSSNVYPPSNMFHSSKTKLTNPLDVKEERVLQHVKYSELSTVCSSIESLKSTSDQFMNIYSRRSNRQSQNTNTKENDLSKNKDFTLQRRNVQLLPLDPNVINHQSSSTIPPLTQNGAYARNAKYNPCKEFTDTVYKCKSFLKELQCNDKRLRSLNRSSEMNKVPSSKAAHAAKRTDLSTIKKRETSYAAPVTAKKEKTNEMKYMERIKDNTVQDIEEPYCSSKVNAFNDTVLRTNGRASSRECIPIVPIMRPAHNAQSSQETLHEVRRRLQSLHNVLQKYQETSRSSCSNRQESAKRIDEMDSFITYPVVDSSSEYFELNCSEESLSSLAEYSSHTSKTNQRSKESVTLRNIYSKEFSQNDVRESVRSNLPAFVTTESHLPSCNSILRKMPKDYGNECKRSEQNGLDHSRNHELEPNAEANKDAIKTDTLFNTRDSISEAMSEKIFYILSPENKTIQTQNEASLEKRFAIENFSNEFDKEKRYQENVTISQNSSQNKISNNREAKSMALLLQEALHFKNALLIQSRKQYPMNNIKQGDIADEIPSVSNNNFPSMIIDVKEEPPVVSKSHDKINQRYICLEMKQRRDVFPQPLKKINTFAHREDERGIESQDRIPETSSEYFSITDLAVHNNAEIENNVALTPPVYDKVISITIPVNVKSQDEINMNERPMQTKAVLPNIETHLRENLTENAAFDVVNNVVNKRSSAVLKLEDLILERVKNIRDYMNIFLQSQNTAIFKARRALQCQGKNDSFQCSDEASHVVIYNRSIAPSNCNSNDQIISSSKKSSDFLTHTWPNYIQKYKQETDDALKCSSDVYLKRNPGMFALITPIKNKFSNKNDTRQLEIPTEEVEADLSLPTPLTFSCKNDSKSTHRITDSLTPRCEKHIPNDRNDKMIKKTIVDINTDFHMDFQRRRQAQVTESKLSYSPLDVANADAKGIHVARKEYLTKSNCNSISYSSSYFTDEEIISDMKIDNIASKSALNMKHSHAMSNIQKEKTQNVNKQVDECSDANIAMPSKSDNEYSNLTMLINSNLILDKAQHDYSNAKTTSPLIMLEKNELIFNPGASLLSFSLDKKNKTLNADDTSLNNLKHDETKNDEIVVDTAHFSPQIEHYSTKPFQTYSQIKAKSDISLITNRNKNLKVNLYPKKSHSFLMRHNIVAYTSGTLHQPCAKLHNDKNKCIKNKLRLATQSKSIILPRKGSTKSCIPILKNRLESSHRMKRQAQARSPMRSPLTMLWREKTCTRDHMTDEEIAPSDNVSMNRHLHVETVLNLTKLNTEKNILDKKLEKSENVTCRDSDIPKKNLGILSSDRDVKSLTIDKEHSDKKDTHESDTSIIKHLEKIASKEVIVISIIANDSLRKKYPADLFILNTKNISPATDLLIHKNKLWTIIVDKTEKEVTAKPSVTDTCTSMSALHE